MSSGEYNSLNIVEKLSVNGKSDTSKNSLFTVNGSSKLYGSLEIIQNVNTIESIFGGTIVIGNKPLSFIPRNSFIIGNLATFNHDIYSNKTLYAKNSFLNGNVVLGESINDNITIKGTVTSKNSFLNGNVVLGESINDNITIKGTVNANGEPITIKSPLTLKQGLNIEGYGSPIIIGNKYDTVKILGVINENVVFDKKSVVSISKIQGPLSIENQTYLNSSVTIGSTSSDIFNVKATTNIKGNITIGTTSADILKINSSISGNLNVSGDLTTENLNVSGNIKGPLKVTDSLSVSGPLNVSGQLTVNNIPCISTTQFIRIDKIPSTRIQLIQSGVFNGTVNGVLKHGLVSGSTYKDIFRIGDKIKSGGTIYTIVDNTEVATIEINTNTTTTTKPVGFWLYLDKINDKPVSYSNNNYIEFYHHYVLDTEYYNLVEFYLDTNNIPDVSTIYLFLPYAVNNKGRPVTFINRSYNSSYNSSNNNISPNIVIRTRDTDKINRETDEINLFSRTNDSETTNQVRFVSNGIDTWYII